MRKYEFAPIDQQLLTSSVKVIYSASSIVPLLLELISFVDAYSGKDGEEGKPTKKWFDEIFTPNTSGALREAIEVLSQASSNEALTIMNKFDLEL